MKSTILVLLLVCVATCLADFDVVSCQVCEDVVQTWHDRFRCAGEIENFDQMRTCDGPVFTCSEAPDEASCNGMRDELKTDDVASSLWKSIRREGNVYGACVKLGKCAEEDGTTSDCHKTLMRDPDCKGSPTCTAVNVCTNECYLCNRLVSEWPIFMENCRPPFAIVPNEVESKVTIQMVKIAPETPQPEAETSQPEAEVEEASPAALLDLEQAHDASEAVAHIEELFAHGHIGEDEYHALLQLQMDNHSSAMIESASEASDEAHDEDMDVTQDKPAYFSHVAYDADPEAFTYFMEQQASIQASEDGEDLTPQCHAMWEEMGNSRRARYMMSYKKYTMPELNPDDLRQSLAWDAHSVCKCLGKCGTEPGETLSLVNVCKYTRMHELQMKLAFPAVSNP